MKKIIAFLCVLTLGFGVCLAGHLVYLYFHTQFEPKDFRHEFVFRDASSKISPEDNLKEKASQILNQPFSYIGHGHQMTAFESADHRYVLKLFNPRPALNEETFHSIAGMKHLCSLKWISHAYLKRESILMQLADSYKIAFRELKEETGLVYIHLDNSTCLSKAIHLSTKKGVHGWIDLDKVPFILQEKAEIAAIRLQTLIQNNEMDKAKKALIDLYTFFEARARKGITDRQQTLYNNYGFIGDRVVQIDVGRIKKDGNIQTMPNEEIKRVFGHINKFLSGKYPQLSPFFLETAQDSHLDF
jgi:hypothetical protein